MTSGVLLVSILLGQPGGAASAPAAAPPAAAAPAAVAPAMPAVDATKSCQTCHADVTTALAKTDSVHRDLSCADCHPPRGFNPHTPAEIDAYAA